jgi:hypothetical protein
MGNSVPGKSALGLTVFVGLVSGMAGPGNGQECASWALRATGGPPAREYHALVYDAGQGATVLFGGYTEPDIHHGDTWERDGAMWTLKATDWPVARTRSATAYDSARGSV